MKAGGKRIWRGAKETRQVGAGIGRIGRDGCVGLGSIGSGGFGLGGDVAPPVLTPAPSWKALAGLLRLDLSVNPANS
jgi:hypothetical protein